MKCYISQMDNSVPVISRADARVAGHTHFFTGVPCRNGHLAARFVSNGSCIKCAALRFKEFLESKPPDYARNQMRYYRANHPAYRLYERTQIFAHTNKIEFTIDSADICIPEKCECCGGFFAKTFKKYQATIFVARIDERIGFTRSNIAIICRQCKKIKTGATVAQIEAVLKWMKSRL